MILDSNYDFEVAAKRILFGKIVNSGQVSDDSMNEDVLHHHCIDRYVSPPITFYYRRVVTRTS